MKTIIFETIKELKQLFCFHDFVHEDLWYISKDGFVANNSIVEVKCEKCGAFDFATLGYIEKNPKKFRQEIK